MKSHDEEGGEDDIGEEGDEVDHFPIRLTIIKIVTWIVHISSSMLREAKHKPLDTHEIDCFKIDGLQSINQSMSSSLGSFHLHPLDKGYSNKSPGESKATNHLNRHSFENSGRPPTVDCHIMEPPYGGSIIWP